jgi:FAD/FMN-containing dehydrogenase
MARTYRRGDPGYASARGSAVWNGVVPERFPDAIVRLTTRDEVAPAVRAAVKDGLRIAVKSGGHSWIGPSIRDGGILFDFSDLNAIEVDPQRRLALVEPGATHQVLADAIVPHELGFPIGHCPSVGIGGYLLAGGYGWNPRTWGPACWSVEAMEVVDLNGEEQVISDTNHPDLFWAGRGGGGGFPAIATRYHLRLQTLPKIASVRCDYALDRLPELLSWSAELESMPAGTEVSLIAHRPPHPGTGMRSEPRATVQASGFAETPTDAMQLARAASDAAPGNDARIDARVFPDVRLNGLEGEGAWVEGLRYAVDMCWISDAYTEVARICERAVRDAPSELSRIVFAWGFAPTGGAEVAQTANGTLTINLYAIWTDPRYDEENVAWVRSTIDRIEPWITGFYVGEADLAVTPERARRCYPPEKWQRLAEIRSRHDPERRKFGYLSES